MSKEDIEEFTRALEISHGNQLAGEPTASAGFDAWMLMTNCEPGLMDRLQTKPARDCGCGACQRAFLEAK